LRSTLTRLFVVTALLVILPFSGIRVICVELPAEDSATEAADHELTDCEQLCALHRDDETAALGSRLLALAKAQSPEPEAETMREVCALTADGAILDCVAFSAIAVVAAQQPEETPAIARNLYVDSSRLHLDPALAPAGPPPKRAR
jgi:hypothetical protein